MKISKNIQKSVLRYPGGKSKAVKIILELIPEDTREIVSPFFGGGSIELACASLGIKIYGYDIFKPLVNFWKYAIINPTEMAAKVRKFLPLTKDDFYKFQKEQMDITDSKKSGLMFFVLNRASFSGSSLSGGMSPNHPRFNEGAISRLENFKVNNLTVDCMDFKESILKHPKALLYCDPPYLIKNILYGNKGDTHKDFDHLGLFNILNKRDNWILSYNDNLEIREIYKEYKILEPKWKYGMGNDKNSREIIILSKDIAKKNKL